MKVCKGRWTMNNTLEQVKEAKLFENCSALFLYLVKRVWNVEDIMNAVAETEKEANESAVIKSTISAFALGFFLGNCTKRSMEELIQEVADGRGTEEGLLFVSNLIQLQKKLQILGILPSKIDSFKS
jgi:ClpP class serine protease